MMFLSPLPRPSHDYPELLVTLSCSSRLVAAPRACGSNAGAGSAVTSFLGDCDRLGACELFPALNACTETAGYSRTPCWAVSLSLANGCCILLKQRFGGMRCMHRGKGECKDPVGSADGKSCSCSQSLSLCRALLNCALV